MKLEELLKARQPKTLQRLAALRINDKDAEKLMDHDAWKKKRGRIRQTRHTED